MSCESAKSSKGSYRAAQAMVHQTPRYENQVIGRRSKIIRRDKRKKHKFY